MNEMIHIEHLTKSYGKNRGIIDINLDIYEGEIFGLIGPNGAGKSTLIKTLLSLFYKTSGSATIFGKDIHTQSTSILEDIGYLPSEVFYYQNMKAIDLLNYSASFYHHDCREKIAYLAKKLDLNLNQKISKMSLGNKKKVGIVQGLLHSPKLIILDEPISGLDPFMQQTFFELIKEENKNAATILFSSHILSEVQKICDRVGILKEGRLIEVSHIATLTSSQYKKVKFVSQAPTHLDLEGITNLQHQQQTTSFLYKGNIQPLIQQLSKINLNNLDISDPSLEEIFMHYYTKDETL